MFSCEKCFKTFDKPCKLRMHQNKKNSCDGVKEQKDFSCDICNKQFSSNYNLQRHQLKCVEKTIERLTIDNSTKTTTTSSHNTTTSSHNTTTNDSSTTTINNHYDHSTNTYIYNLNPVGEEDFDYINPEFIINMTKPTHEPTVLRDFYLEKKRHSVNQNVYISDYNRGQCQVYKTKFIDGEKVWCFQNKEKTIQEEFDLTMIQFCTYLFKAKQQGILDGKDEQKIRNDLEREDKNLVKECIENELFNQKEAIKVIRKNNNQISLPHELKKYDWNTYLIPWRPQFALYSFMDTLHSYIKCFFTIPQKHDLLEIVLTGSQPETQQCLENLLINVYFDEQHPEFHSIYFENGSDFAYLPFTETSTEVFDEHGKPLETVHRGEMGMFYGDQPTARIHASVNWGKNSILSILTAIRDELEREFITILEANDKYLFVKSQMQTKINRTLTECFTTNNSQLINLIHSYSQITTYSNSFYTMKQKIMKENGI